ncbi:MAG: hypothetical protein DRQ63_00815 [Gammaproteobacteria bacterium]|nr:MAG: hypothetical protein DRQ63_00815 [Gammaproteobacteria bacterium]
MGAVILLAASGPAAAQTVEQSDLALCASLATSELKLACFEALTAIEGKVAPLATDAAAEPLPESAAMDKAPETAAAAAGLAGSDAGPVVPAPAATASDDQAEVVDELGRELPDEEQVDRVDEIGREHLSEEKNVEKEETVVRATVSEVVQGGYDVLYFHFANGQVWRQLESRRFSYPRDGEFDVVIDTGMMGEYRLRLDAGGPMTRIRRIR